MQLSGRLTGWQLRFTRLKPLWALLFFAAMGAALAVPLIRGARTALDPGLLIADLAFGPVIGLMAAVLVWWLERDRVVEFSCDDASFRFRKLGASETEARTISDIVKVEGMGRSGTTGYCISFRNGSDALVSIRLAPGGPLLGEWFQACARNVPAERPAPPSSWTEGDWCPPRELQWPAPRRVRVTRGGVALCAIAAAVVVGADDGMMSYVRTVNRQAADLQQTIRDSQEIQGIVTRLWKPRRGGPRITYRYFAEGTNWSAPATRVSRRHWESLRAGGPISVLYKHGDPATSFPAEDPPYVPPSWVAWVIMPILTGFGILPFLAVIRARRFLAFGTPAPARVSSVDWYPGKPATVHYRFLVNGTLQVGSYLSDSLPPAENSIIPVLYDPKDPGHNTRYPVSLARLAPE